MLYLASMRILLSFLCILLSIGCSTRRISNEAARQAILYIPQTTLQENDVDVVKVIQVGGTEAIAETRLKTAFRLEKVKNAWVVKEVRIGRGEWEKIENIGVAVENVKKEETLDLLDRIAEGIRKFLAANGRLPEFKDYVMLSDQLSPRYMTPLIRLDAWRKPLEAERLDANTILLRSSGPDGISGTADDIRLIVKP